MKRKQHYLEEIKHLKSYVTEIKRVHDAFLNFLESDENGLYHEFLYFLENHRFIDDKYKLEAILILISLVTSNHQRSNNFLQKIQDILQIIDEKIIKFFSNMEIFNIFKYNKRLLLYFFNKKIIIPDNSMFCIISNYKHMNMNFLSYFYPEFENFFDNTEKEKYNKEYLKYDHDIFDMKRKCGENDNYICQLIRQDSIEEFIAYVNQANIYLNLTIEPSIYETNNFLNGKHPKLIEYAAFFGSIQIFQYLRFNNVELTPEIWLYAIHGKNAEIIHILEENHIIPNDSTYFECLKESIKCHHNEIASYFQNVYNVTKETFLLNLKYHNYSNFPMKIELSYDNFYYFCNYNYYELAKFCLNNCVIKNANQYNIKKIKNKKYKFIKYFFLKDGYLQVEYERMKTPLYIAIQKGNKDIVELLLEKKVDVNLKSNISFATIDIDCYSQISPLYAAVENDQIEIVQLLLNHKKINVNLIDVISYIGILKKRYVLHNAVEKGNFDMIQILLKNSEISKQINSYEIDTISKIDVFCQTPLHIAIGVGNEKIIQFLLSNQNIDCNYKRKAYNINSKDGESITPLQLAIFQKKVQIIKILLMQNKINLENALDSAIETGIQEIIDILKDVSHPTNNSNQNQQSSKICTKFNFKFKLFGRKPTK